VGHSFPAFIAIVLTGFSPGTLYKAAVVVALGLGAATMERLASMQDNKTVWSDAIEKNGTQASANAVGRARPYLNRGMLQLKRLDFESALRDFSAAQAVGATGGEALFAMGMTLHAMGHPGDALPQLQKAEEAGYANTPVLQFHRGESQFVLGMYEQAVASYTKALEEPSKAALESPNRVPVELARAHRAEAEVRLQNYAGAKADFEALVPMDPKQNRYRIGLGLALLGLKDAAGALKVFDALAQEKPDALAFYGRALAQYNLSNKAAAAQDIARAIELDPSNLAYKQVQESIKKGERLSL